MIKNVVFDIGNVLVNFRWRELMCELGFSPECIATLTGNMVQHPLWDELDMGIRPHADIISDMKALSPMYARQIDCFFDNIGSVVCRQPHSAAWPAELKARGMGVYLLSNYPDWVFELHRPDFEFLPYVDGMVVSAHVHMMKPDPRIYRLLLEKYSLSAEECVFIDDRADNCVAAEGVGMRAIHFTSAEQAQSELEDMLTK